MLVARRFSYRFAEAILRDPAFEDVVSDLVEILEQTGVPIADTSPEARDEDLMKQRSRKATKKDSRERFLLFPVDQGALNTALDNAFAQATRPWQRHPLVVPPTEDGRTMTKLEADFRRQRVQLEIQFGNAARWYADVFKFQLSYSLDVVDVAILVVPTKDFANFIDDNISHFERVIRELPAAKLSLTVPILVLGVEPGDWDRIRVAYDEAASLREMKGAVDGGELVRIPFDARKGAQPLETAVRDITAD